MRKRYKNKRDQYKAERDEFERKATRLEREAEECREERKKRFNCIIYCENCQLVYSATVPHSQTIKASGCAYCGVRNVGHLVSEIKQ